MASRTPKGTALERCECQICTLLRKLVKEHPKTAVSVRTEGKLIVGRVNGEIIERLLKIDTN